MRVYTLYIGVCLGLVGCATDLQQRIDRQVTEDIASVKQQRLKAEANITEPRWCATPNSPRPISTNTTSPSPPGPMKSWI